MNKLALACAIGALSLLFVASSSASEVTQDKHAELLKRFDKNGDGKLTGPERAAARRALAQWKAQQRKDSVFDQVDKNNDGTIGPVEANLAKKKVHDKAFDHFDKNDDGTIGPKERAHAHRNRHLREQAANKHPRADRNHDGHVGPAEAKHARKHKKAKTTKRKVNRKAGARKAR